MISPDPKSAHQRASRSRASQSGPSGPCRACADLTLLAVASRTLPEFPWQWSQATTGPWVCGEQVACAFRSRASRGIPSTAVRSGSLPVFPSPWSATTVRWSVPAFLLRMPGGSLPLRRRGLQAHVTCSIRVMGGHGGAHEARNNELHVCARRRVGEAAGSCPLFRRWSRSPSRQR